MSAEDEDDIKAARAALNEPGTVSWDALKKEMEDENLWRSFKNDPPPDNTRRPLIVTCEQSLTGHRWVSFMHSFQLHDPIWRRDVIAWKWAPEPCRTIHE